MGAGQEQGNLPLWLADGGWVYSRQPGLLAPLSQLVSTLCQNSQCHYCVTAFWQNGSFLHSGLTKDVMPHRATLQKLPQSGHLPKGGELNKSKSGRAGLWLSAGCLSNVHKILDSIPALQTPIGKKKSQDTKKSKYGKHLEIPPVTHLARTKFPRSEQPTHRPIEGAKGPQLHTAHP